jgi:isoleucyl-tRNA synthetase
VSAEAGVLQGFAALVADEVNVREVRLLGVDDAGDFGVTQRLTVNARVAGPRLGKDVQVAIRASKSGDWQVADDGQVTAGGLVLERGEYTVETVVAGDGDTSQPVGVLPREGFVVLDTAVTPELEAVGLVRDVVRAVQQARRTAGLHVSDRIRLTVAAEPSVWEALVTHERMLTAETLAVQAGLTGVLDQLPVTDGVVEATVGDGLQVRVRVERVD